MFSRFSFIFIKYIFDEKLQMKLIEIQCDSLLKQQYRFPKMLSFVTRILAMFRSTYLYEQLFSLMKNNKNSERLRLADQHLLSIFKIASAQDIQPNFDDLLCEKRCQISSKK
ncbi:general transcription factor II-I repeat domain-containing protein 2B-like [Calliopsis andreniformis]|uniref:general transcription factor II-I repeat domain-containing protein 2B-like n=1 Tax=Calliopsis andreniformis TaxID=337506 RepID=UPI003FCE8647